MNEAIGKSTHPPVVILHQCEGKGHCLDAAWLTSGCEIFDRSQFHALGKLATRIEIERHGAGFRMVYKKWGVAAPARQYIASKVNVSAGCCLPLFRQGPLDGPRVVRAFGERCPGDVDGEGGGPDRVAVLDLQPYADDPVVAVEEAFPAADGRLLAAAA